MACASAPGWETACSRGMGAGTARGRWRRDRVRLQGYLGTGAGTGDWKLSVEERQIRCPDQREPSLRPSQQPCEPVSQACLGERVCSGGGLGASGGNRLSRGLGKGGGVSARSRGEGVGGGLRRGMERNRSACCWVCPAENASTYKPHERAGSGCRSPRRRRFPPPGQRRRLQRRQTAAACARGTLRGGKRAAQGAAVARG